MRARRVESRNILDQTVEIPLPAGYYAGMMLYYKGTVGSGTFNFNNLNPISVRFRGETLANVRPYELYIYNQLRGGLPLSDGGSGTPIAWKLIAILPFRYGLLKTNSTEDNVLNIGIGEAFLQVPAVSSSNATSASVDVVMLEDIGVSRYIPIIVSRRYEYTGQDRIILSTPNLRHILIQQPIDATTLPISVLMSSANRILFEGDWAQLQALTNLDSEVESSSVGYVMPDFGNNNPATYARGKFELQIIGTTPGASSYIVEFGYIPVKPTETDMVRAAQLEELVQQINTSPAPPAVEVAPLNVDQIQINTIRITKEQHQAPFSTLQTKTVKVF